MTVTRPEEDTRPGISRRVLAKGAAWTVPAVAVAAAAPALAASPPPPGLQGWVQISKDCNRNTDDVLEIDGRGDYPDNGLWVYYTTAATVLTNAKITFYYPTSLGVLTWATATGNASWSAPAYDAGDTSVAGHYAYTTTYSGNWTFVDAPGTNPDYKLAVGDPHFTASKVIDNCGDTVGVYARRTVTVDGLPITFLRGPVNI